MKRFFLLILLSLPSFLSSVLYPSSILLKNGDVSKIMDDLFEYHVQEKQISPKLIERSFAIAIEDFDEAHAYLLQSEVDEYLLYSQRVVSSAYSEYLANRFDTYFALNSLFQKAALRAREWRAQWMREAKQLVRASDQLAPFELKKSDGFCLSLEELKKRHFELFAALVRKVATMDTVQGKESLICSLANRRLNELENSYVGEANEDYQKMQHRVLVRTLKALARSLDAHTAYFSPEEAFAMKVQLEKGMCGIGVVLREGIEGVFIAELVKGGPADKCGSVVAGDRLIEINGTSVEQASFQRVLEMLRGKEGEKVILTLGRALSEGLKNGSAERRLECTLVRSKIVLEDKRVDVDFEPFSDGIVGKIRLYSFYEGEDGVSSEKDIRRAIEELKGRGKLYGLVLDMRDNAGGFLSQSVKVSGIFISSGIVVASKYSDGSKKYYRTVEGRRFYDGPLVVLVSKESASAAEIVAQALQDYGVALVVGDEQTYGKGTIQHQTLTRDKSEAFFKVTIGRYYTASGKSTQIEGVKSDIVVPTEYCFADIGERYLDNPLPSDHIAPLYNDPLDDIDPPVRKWFSRYYLPTVQQKQQTWVKLLPHLRATSQARLANNADFQAYLRDLKNKSSASSKSYAQDFQMQEAVEIIKEMVLYQ